MACIERFFATDLNNPAASAKAQREIPVMWDKALWAQSPLEDCMRGYNHFPGGASVLFMGGHFEFVKYQAKWPICSTWISFVSLIVSMAL